MPGSEPVFGPSPHPLNALGVLASEQVAALQKHWITTAEEFLALSSTPQGRDGLKSLLAMDDPGLQGLLATMTKVVGEESAQRLQEPVPAPGQLGAALTEEQKKRFGIE